MKIAVSYLSSNDYKTSIKKIENSKADFVHCDICDGTYVKTNNFKLAKNLFSFFLEIFSLAISFAALCLLYLS